MGVLGVGGAHPITLVEFDAFLDAELALSGLGPVNVFLRATEGLNAITWKTTAPEIVAAVGLVDAPLELSLGMVGAGAPSLVCKITGTLPLVAGLRVMGSASITTRGEMAFVGGIVFRGDIVHFDLF